MEDLRDIRLACRIKKKGRKGKYQREEIHSSSKKLLKTLKISPDDLQPNINLSEYTTGSFFAVISGRWRFLISFRSKLSLEVLRPNGHILYPL
jgi:hypothetical protein